MKNYLTLVLALSVVSAPAFASRARLEALGEGKNGSYFIDDARNIFLDPAQLVHYKKKLWLETGIEPVANGTNAQDAAVTGNRAQGGFSNTFGDFTYGVYMNQTSERTLNIIQSVDSLGALVNSDTNFIAPDSTIEVFFAGEGALNWGISAFYAGNNVKGSVLTPTVAGAGVERTASQVGVRLGVDMNAFKVFTTIALANKSNVYDGSTQGNEIKGKIGIDLGAEYVMNDMTAFAKATMVGADVNTTVVTELRQSQYGIGAGWKHEMTKSTNLFARTEFDYAKSGAAQLANSTVQTTNIPVVVGAESQALSWLAIRGSIAESIWGQQWNGQARNNLGGTTTVALGLGLTFGDVQIDGLVATNGTSNPANGVAGFGTAPQTNTGFGFGDNMLTRVALTYNF